MPRDGRGEVAYRGRAPLLHDRPEPGIGRRASEQPGAARRVIEMGAADRGGVLAMAAGQRRVHELHAVARAARRAARDHGVAVAVRVELRRDRGGPPDEHRPRPPRLRWVDRLLQPAVQRRDGRDRCAGTSMRWSPRRRPAGPGGTTSRGSSPTSSRLERAFWDMAYTLERWPDLDGRRPAPLGLTAPPHADIQSRPSRCDA